MKPTICSGMVMYASAVSFCEVSGWSEVKLMSMVLVSGPVPEAFTTQFNVHESVSEREPHERG